MSQKEEIRITRFRGRSNWTMVEAEVGPPLHPNSVTVRGFQIFSLEDIELLITALREAAKIAGLK